MTVKRKKRSRSLAFDILITASFHTIIVGFSPYFAVAQVRPEVILFEFTLKYAEKGDREFRMDLQDHIVEELEKSKQSKKVERISEKEMLDLSRNGGIEKYLEEKKIRYVIRGEMVNLPRGNMRIQVELIDRGVEGANKDTTSWKKTLGKNLSMTHWFERVSGNISSMIEGIPKREVVFTYSFKTIGEEDNDIRKLRQRLPGKLKTILSASWSERYELKSVDDVKHVVEKCNEIHLVSDETNVGKFCIFGEIVPQGPQILEIAVTVHVIGNREEFLDEYEKFEDIKGLPSGSVAQRLSKYIVKNWNHIIKN